MTNILGSIATAVSIVALSGVAQASVISGEIDGRVFYGSTPDSDFSAKYTIDTSGKADVTFKSQLTGTLIGSADVAGAVFKAYDPDPVTMIPQQEVSVLLDASLKAPPRDPGSTIIPPSTSPIHELPPGTFKNFIKTQASSLSYTMHLNTLTLLHDAQFYDTGAPYDLDLRSDNLSTIISGGYLIIVNSKGQEGDFYLDVSHVTVNNIAFGTDLQFEPSLSAVPLPASAPLFGIALIALGATGYAAKRKTVAAAA